MSQRSDWEARTRSHFLVRLGGATVALFLFATAATAAISSFDPSSGSVEPKGSASTSFTVVDSSTSCFTASAPPRFEVAFDGLGLDLLPFNCALEGTRVTLTVTAGAKASPGDYEVTITETSIGGELLGSHEWPFRVPAPPSSTTTTTPETTTTTQAQPTTTSAGTTTSTASATTTSTRATTTTSTSGVTRTTDDSTDTNPEDPSSSGNPTNPSNSADDPASPSSREGENGPGDEVGGATTDTSADQPAEGEDDTEALAAGSTDGDDGLPYVRYPAKPGDVAPEVLSRTVFSDQLRSQLTRALPLAVVDAVLSPVVIAEFLYHSLLQSAMGLLVPILLATLVGLVMVWRMREEINDDELALSRQSLG